MTDVDDTEAKKTASAAAEIVVSLDDLLLEIFRHVPSEKDQNPLLKLASKHLNSLVSEFFSLKQLRLVSRHWNSLISTNLRRNPKPFPAAGLIFECGPTSEHNYYTRHRPHHSYIIFLDQSIITTTPFRTINSADDPWHSRSKVIHSCNGLLLCASKRARGVYYVCNPTTGKHSTLPRLSPVDMRGVYLAFDSSKSAHYKVVCVFGSEDESPYSQFVVYSSETGYWGKPVSNNVRFGNGGVYWNGAIHWVGSSQLICINPDDDGLAPKVLPMPIARDEYFYFGESYGHLHYIGLNNYGVPVREFVVHEMSSDYSGWAVKYKFDPSFYNDTYISFNVYAMVRGERGEDTFLVLWTRARGWGEKKKIIRLNLDATFETIYDFNGYKNPLQNPEELVRPFHYIDSLASV